MSFNDKYFKRRAVAVALVVSLSLSSALVVSGCASSDESASNTTSSAQSTSTAATSTASSSGGILNLSDIFTQRDLEQVADTSNATAISLSDGEDVHITEEGVYVLSGSASNVTVYVEADDTAKVQIVLDGVSITNESTPAIYVASADKVFVTTASDSALSVTGSYSFSSDDAADAAIFSRSDLVLNGTATLTVDSSDNAVTSKDSLKITGGTYVVTAGSKGFEANDELLIADGDFTVNAQSDGFHAENEDDGSLGYIYIAGGSFNISAGKQAIQASSVIQVNDGSIVASAAEGIEATYIQVNGGDLQLTATDDGVNATQSSAAYTATVEITGGSLTIDMGNGDTDAIDSNGDLIISGGSVSITANSAFDFDGNGTLSGSTVTVNGEQISELSQQMAGAGK